MAALLAQHPGVHLTINFSPVLLRQIEDYTERGFTDRALDLTLTPTDQLSAGEREVIVTQFFDADWHHEIYPHARYKQLLEQRAAASLSMTETSPICGCGSTSLGSGQSFGTGR